MLKDFRLDYKQYIPNYYEDDTKEVFLLISLLHINGFISDKSLFAQFKNLKRGKMIRVVTTYHSKINDTWYNDETIKEIYRDILDDMINHKSGKLKLKFDRINKLRALNGLEPKVSRTYLNFEETLSYLNKYLNKNRNFCVDHLFHEFIKPSVSNLSEDNNHNLSNMFNYSFTDIINRNSVSRYDYDYCCDYCCGTYSEWQESNTYRQKEELNRKIRAEFIGMVDVFLNSKREQFKDCYKKFTL